MPSTAADETTIVRTLFGSKLYGTATASSDTDLKSVFVPSARDIALQRVKPAVSRGTGDPALANAPGDTDEDAFALHRYLQLLEKGESFALEMLFTPPELTLATSKAWETIRANRSRLVTRKSAGFFGYAKRQAELYGAKGERIAALRAAVALLEALIDEAGPTAKLGAFAARIEAFADAGEHARTVDLPTVSGEPLRHLEVCGKKMGYTTALKVARDVFARTIEDYGARALAAERNEGVDWKAMSHAVRIGCQGVELLDTGAMTFPRPEASELLAIRAGEVPYARVADRLEGLLQDIETAGARSALPESVDRDWIEETVFELYAGQFA